MTDIVERLRRGDLEITLHERLEIASEIERLRNELAQWTSGFAKVELTSWTTPLKDKP